MKNLPFVAFGNEEIAAAPKLGKTIKCWMCKKKHKIEYGKEKAGEEWVDSTKIAFFTCGKKTYLAGIAGKEMRPRG